MFRKAVATAGSLVLFVLAGCAADPVQPASFTPASGSTTTSAADAPQPISRAELMSRYAKINPLDSSATPASMDENADLACSKLRQGVTTDQLITAVTPVYKTNTTEVIMLLVSYKCPEFLKDFK